MDITNEAHNILNRYFSLLGHTGYKVYSEVDKILVFLFIEELLTGPLSEYITDEDYNAISNALYCLYGTCTIPYPDYKRAVDSIVSRLPDKYRISEDSILRRAEDYSPRIKA